MNDARAIAAQIIAEVIHNHAFVSQCAPSLLEKLDTPRDRAFTQELVYGVFRFYPRLTHQLQHLLKKSLKAKDLDITALLLVGLYQLLNLDIPAYAAVSTTVQACYTLKKGWAASLVNGILRNVVRQQKINPTNKVPNDEEALYAHPAWLIERLKTSWPTHWKTILTANNQHPPMLLRVNQRKTSRDIYLNTLIQLGLSATPTPHSTDGIELQQPLPVQQLPGFQEGLISVQDTAAQLCLNVLDIQPGQRILDACAAPGGKTAHLLEKLGDSIELIALDKYLLRCKMLSATLQRLDLNCQIFNSDATDLAGWWDQQCFDRVLLDSPCSATGVIRRHPEIKILRDEPQIAMVMQEQSKLLAALWTVLKPGGKLLYATCSVLPEENTGQIKKFVELNQNALVCPIVANWGYDTGYGRQILTGENNMDGFFYALLQKSPQ